MGAYRALSDSIRELNSILISKQEFDGQMEVERAKINMDNQERMERAKDRALNREIVQDKVNKIREFNTPQDFSFNSILPQEYLANPVMRQGMTKILNPTGTEQRTLNAATGQIVGPRGVPMKMSMKELNDMMPGILAVTHGATDTPLKMQQEAVKQTELLTDYKAQYAKAKSQKNTAAAAAIAPHIAQTSQALAQAQEFFTPRGQQVYWKSQKEIMNKAGFWARSNGIDSTWFDAQGRDAANKETDAMNKAFAAGKGTTYKPVRAVFYNRFTEDEMGRGWLSVGDRIEDLPGWVKGVSVETRPRAKGDGSKAKPMTFDQFNTNVDVEMKNRFPQGMNQAGQNFVSTWKNTGTFLNTPEGSAAWGPQKADGSPHYPNGMPFELAQGYADSLVKEIHANYWDAKEEIGKLSNSDVRDELVERASDEDLDEHYRNQIAKALAGSNDDRRDALNNLNELDFEFDLQSITGGVQQPFLPSDSLKIMMRR
jgi:hypothetical protein